MPRKEKDRSAEIKAAKKKIAIWAGLIAGLAFSITLWGSDAVSLMSANAAHPWAKLIMGVLPVTGLCVLAAWLSQRIGRWIVSVLIMAACVALIGLFAGHLPFEGLMLYYKVFDPQLAAKVQYPYNATIATRVGAGLMVSALFGGLSGVFFGRMLDNAASAEKKAAAILPILFWSVFFISSGWLMNSFVQTPLQSPVSAINQLVEYGITNETAPYSQADAQAMNLAALDPATGLIHLPRRLALSGYDATLSLFSVVVDFDGQWVDCTVAVDYGTNPPAVRPVECGME